MINIETKNNCLNTKQNLLVKLTVQICTIYCLFQLCSVSVTHHSNQVIINVFLLLIFYYTFGKLFILISWYQRCNTDDQYESISYTYSEEVGYNNNLIQQRQ